MRTIGAMNLNIADTPSLARRAVDEGLPIDPITAQRLIAANAECMRVLMGIIRPIGRGVTERGDMVPPMRRARDESDRLWDAIGPRITDEEIAIRRPM